VEWRILTQEELDAHRQALVEQFRAEVDAASEAHPAEPIPDVLPTGETPAVAEAEDAERDDELERLQRLLGMTKAAATAAGAADGDSEEEADDSADAEAVDSEEDED
jgi:hypothetical protein